MSERLDRRCRSVVIAFVYCLTALALGPALHLGLWLLPWTRWVVTAPWMGPLPGSPLEVSLAFAVTTLLVAAWFRRRICAGEASWPLAIAALAAGGTLQPVVWAVVVTAPSGWGAVVRDIPSSLVLSLFGAAFAILAAPVELPLVWLAIRLLRWASGGAASVERSALSASRA